MAWRKKASPAPEGMPQEPVPDLERHYAEIGWDQHYVESGKGMRSLNTFDPRRHKIDPDVHRKKAEHAAKVIDPKPFRKEVVREALMYWREEKAPIDEWDHNNIAILFNDVAKTHVPEAEIKRLITRVNKKVRWLRRTASIKIFFRMLQRAFFVACTLWFVYAMYRTATEHQTYEQFIQQVQTHAPRP